MFSPLICAIFGITFWTFDCWRGVVHAGNTGGGVAFDMCHNLGYDLLETRNWSLCFQATPSPEKNETRQCPLLQRPCEAPGVPPRQKYVL